MQNVAADLAQMLGVERVLWEQEHLVTYGFDGTAALYGEAGCIALPKTTEEVSQVVRYAAKHRIPVVTRGSGTGLSGGSVPVPGCIVLCLVQMDRVAPTETMTERSGILAGGNWIVDRTKMIDCYPAQDALANIMQEASSTGGAPYNMLIDVARLGPAALNPSRLFLTAPALFMM